MRFIRFLFVVGFFILASCSQKEETLTDTSTPDKAPFYISVYSIEKDTLKTEVQKSWRVSSKSTLTLTSKGVGEVAKIEVKEGSQVKAGSVIARLKDTLTNYDLQLAQAENALKIQNASKETTTVNLESAIESSRIAYERAKQAYDTLMNRNALQYDLTVSGNKKTLDAYNESYRSYMTELEKTYTQILHEGDKILWITTNFQYANDSWENYLGARIGSVKADADNEWNKSFALRGELRARIEKWLEINRENPEADIELIARGYEQMRKYLDTMLNMLQNNVIWWGLPQVQQDAWLLAWNGYRASVGWSESGYNAWKSQTVTFFKNYRKTERATKLAIASLDRELTADENTELTSDSDLKITYENTRLDLVERTRNSELSLEQAKMAYESAQALKKSTLEQLEWSRRSAEISLELARRNADNLIIRVPVSGTISKVLTSIGQSVATGTPVAEFTSNEPEIVLDIESNLARTLSIGEEVEVSVEGKVYKWTIIALSSVAGKNLLSTIRVSVTDGSSAIGKTATITFYPKESIDGEGLISLPLESVRIIAENEWEIRYLSGESIATKNIKISAIRSGFVETTDSIDPSMQVILSDTTNYDTTKHKLTIQKN